MAQRHSFANDIDIFRNRAASCSRRLAYSGLFKLKLYRWELFHTDVGQPGLTLGAPQESGRLFASDSSFVACAADTPVASNSLTAFTRDQGKEISWVSVPAQSSKSSHDTILWTPFFQPSSPWTAVSWGSAVTARSDLLQHPERRAGADHRVGARSPRVYPSEMTIRRRVTEGTLKSDHETTLFCQQQTCDALYS